MKFSVVIYGNFCLQLKISYFRFVACTENVYLLCWMGKERKKDIMSDKREGTYVRKRQKKLKRKEK